MRSTSSPRAVSMMIGTCERLQLAAERQPILPRQHQIEHQQIHVRALHDAAHFLSVRDGGGAEIVLLEILGQQAADLAIVVDDEKMGALAHLSFAGWLRPRILPPWSS